MGCRGSPSSILERASLSRTAHGRIAHVLPPPQLVATENLRRCQAWTKERQSEPSVPGGLHSRSPTVHSTPGAGRHCYRLALFLPLEVHSCHPNFQEVPGSPHTLRRAVCSNHPTQDSGSYFKHTTPTPAPLALYSLALEMQLPPRRWGNGGYSYGGGSPAAVENS